VVDGPSGHVEAGHHLVKAIHEVLVELQDISPRKAALPLHQHDVLLQILHASESDCCVFVQVHQCIQLAHGHKHFLNNHLAWRHVLPSVAAIAGTLNRRLSHLGGDRESLVGHTLDGILCGKRDDGGLESGVVAPVSGLQHVHGSLLPMRCLQCGGHHVVKAVAPGVRQIEIGQCKPLVIHEKLVAVLDAERTANISWPSIRQTGSLEINFCVDRIFARMMVDGPSGDIEAGHHPVKAIHEMLVELQDFSSRKAALNVHQCDVLLQIFHACESDGRVLFHIQQRIQLAHGHKHLLNNHLAWRHVLLRIAAIAGTRDR